MAEVFKHRWPVWQNEVNTSIFVPVQKDDLYGEEYALEEIPAKAEGNGHYKVCSIPLLVHNINLGDIVETNTEMLYEKTVVDNGRYGFRLAINTPDTHESENIPEFERVIDSLVKKYNNNVEFFSHALVAIDVADRKSAKKISKYLEKMIVDEWLIAYDTIRL